MSAPHKVRHAPRRGRRANHYRFLCNVCHKMQYGTKISHNNHIQNCLKKKSAIRMSK